MHFYKAMIFTIILKTVLHKVTGQNFECIPEERNIFSDLWTEYMNHFTILTQFSRPEASMRVIANRTERVITAIMNNVLRDESENENPNQLCLQAVRHCLIYEGPVDYITVTAEGLQKIEGMGVDVLLTQDLYPNDLANFFRIILKSLPALKCKVQISNMPRNNVPFSDVPLDELFTNMTFNENVFPNGVATNRVATNGVTANGFVDSDAHTDSVDSVITNAATVGSGFTYYDIFFSDRSDSDTDSVSDNSDDDSSYAGPSVATSNDTFYFFIFIFRRESKYPMFIFLSSSQNTYSPAFQIQVENKNEQPNDINNNSNGHI